MVQLDDPIKDPLAALRIEASPLTERRVGEEGVGTIGVGVDVCWGGGD